MDGRAGARRSELWQMEQATATCICQSVAYELYAFIFAIFHLLITDTLYSLLFAIAMRLDMLERIALVHLNWILVWNVCRAHNTARGTRRGLHLVY